MRFLQAIDDVEIFLTHVGQITAGLPIQLAAGQTAIRVAGCDIAVPPSDEIHRHRPLADRLETLDNFHDRVAPAES